jgi:hypothetical protein
VDKDSETSPARGAPKQTSLSPQTLNHPYRIFPFDGVAMRIVKLLRVIVAPKKNNLISSPGTMSISSLICYRPLTNLDGPRP